ncbi:hypothetical protein GGR52DRAFT_576042 [Hypoxylon sp. FL1284]|nr:hypothetical protein GGR52DRAFT_576042 [Hypoxylon sp. FL1284]
MPDLSDSHGSDEFPARIEDSQKWKDFNNQEPAESSWGSSSPLNERGWALQERFLSPRILVFEKHKLLWNCKTLVAWKHHEEKFNQQILSAIPIVPDKRAHLTYMGNWQLLVQRFRDTKLTYECDRLAAIEGLVRHFNPQGTRAYLAGLWADSFWGDFVWIRSSVEIKNGQAELSPIGGCYEGMQEYMWMDFLSERFICVQSSVETRNEQVESPPTKTEWSSGRWLFPTWSWASVTGYTHWQSQASRVSSGDILATWKQDAEAPYKLLLESIVVPARLRDLPSAHLRVDGVFHRDYDFSGEGKGFISPDATVYCLRIYKHRRDLKSVALRCIDEAGQLYERIGLVHHREDHYHASHWLPRWWTDGDQLVSKEICLI